MEGVGRGGFLRTRVARRVLFLFILSAVIPVAALVGVVWTAVTGQLRTQAEENLRQLSRNSGQSILQQILLVENGLVQLDAAEEGAADRAAALLETVPAAVAIAVGPPGSEEVVAGPVFRVPALDSSMLSALASGSGLAIPATEPGLLVVSAHDSSAGGIDRVWAMVYADSIWGPAETFASLPSVSAFCVLPGSGGRDYCSDGDLTVVREFRRAVTTETDRLGSFAFSGEDADYFVGYWRFHPAGAFDAEPWSVLVSTTTDSVYAPLSGFNLWFVSIVGLGFGLVVLLSNIQVSRTMRPLEALAEGTRRIASGDYGSRVSVDSGDEFGALAASFNSMADRVGFQLAQLEAGREIDRAVLEDFDQEAVLSAVIRHTRELVEARSVAVLLVDPDKPEDARIAWEVSEEQVGGTSAALSRHEVAWLGSSGEWASLTLDETPFLNRARLGLGPGTVTAFPFLSKGRVRGALLIETPDPSLRPEDARTARQLADQAAVALDDARLVAELEDLSWGALRALARAIDAKSPWTAGHSERVTEMALDLGRIMGLSDVQMDVLQRGGLLHDVGKIGVPAAILNKGERLTVAEFALVRRHPEIGARILEPIRSFAPAIPIVLQHHERWDGRGYPARLSGNQIDPLARILALADTFDAMASARPYRGSIDMATVAAEIESCSGAQFDPEVVQAFRQLMESRGSWESTSEEVVHG